MPSFHGLSPFGPIFAKEIRAMSRRRRNYILRVVYLGMLLLLLSISYATMSNSIWSQSVAARIERQAALGQTFFATFAFFCLVTMTLIGPVLTSTAIGGEKLRKTLHVLLMTPLNTWQILGGKLFSRLLQAIVLLGLSLPVLALVRLLGGVEVWQMAAALSLCLATALLAASVGLFLSTLMTRAYGVILLSYGVLALLYLFTPMIIALSASNTGMRSGAWAAMTAVSSFFAMGVVIYGDMSGLPFGTSGWPCMLLHLGGTALMLLLAAAVLRRHQRHEAAGGAMAAGEPPDLASAIVLSSKQRLVGDNPVRWRELRRPLFAGRAQSIIAALIIVALLGLVYGLLWNNDDLDDRGTHIAFGVIFAAVWWLLAAVLATTVIAQEKESDTWTLLLATPISDAQIVLGKLAGVLKKMWLPTILLIGHFAIFAAAGIVSWRGALVTIWVTISYNSVWIALGVYLSLRLGRVTTAVIVCVALAIGVYFIAPMIETAIFALVGFNRFEGPATVLPLPYLYIWNALDHRFGSGSRIDLPFLDDVSEQVFLGWVLALGLVHLLVAAALLSWTIMRLDSVVGRARQIDAVAA